MCALLQCLARSALVAQRDGPALVTRLARWVRYDVKAGKQRWDAAALVEAAFLLAKLGHDDPGACAPRVRARLTAATGVGGGQTF